MTKMHSGLYHEGYWERGEGSNYVAYGDDPGWGPTLTAMAQCIGHDGKWLEIACAKGFFTRRARAAGVDCWGIDLSAYAIGQAPGDVRPYVQEASVLAIPFPDDTFDVVCSWEFLEHVPLEDLPAALAEIDRVAKPGAHLWHRIGIDTTGDDRFPQGVDQHHHQNDVTHFSEMPDVFWRGEFDDLGWVRTAPNEDVVNAAFADRDWRDRFYVYRRP